MNHGVVWTFKIHGKTIKLRGLILQKNAKTSKIRVVYKNRIYTPTVLDTHLQFRG